MSICFHHLKKAEKTAHTGTSFLTVPAHAVFSYPFILILLSDPEFTGKIHDFHV